MLELPPFIRASEFCASENLSFIGFVWTACLSSLSRAGDAVGVFQLSGNGLVFTPLLFTLAAFHTIWDGHLSRYNVLSLYTWNVMVHPFRFSPMQSTLTHLSAMDSRFHKCHLISRQVQSVWRDLLAHHIERVEEGKKRGRVRKFTGIH